MADEKKSEFLTVEALRGGTVSEVAFFLSDLNGAYAACSAAYYASSLHRRLRRGPYPFWEFGLGWNLESRSRSDDPSNLPPGSELELTQVEIHSPGIWEFLGQLNPLQQIREYLNDRHERRKDKQYRESSERDRLSLENELLRRQIRREDLEIERDEIEMMRDMGIDDETLRQIIWQRTGQHLARLGRHQDTGLIGRAGNKNAIFEYDPREPKF